MEIQTKGTTMKLQDFYKAQALIKEHESMKTLVAGFDRDTTVTINLRKFDDATKKKMKALFAELMLDVEKKLEKI